MSNLSIQSRKTGLGQSVSGPALVLQSAFSARYDLDITTGEFLRPGIAEPGTSVKGCILIADRAKGGVATSWLLNEMTRRGTAPAALVFNNAGPVMVQAAAFAGIPLLDGFDEDITRQLNSGCRVTLDPVTGQLTVPG